MATGNGAQRSDRIEHETIRSLHFVTFPAAIHKKRFDEVLLQLVFKFLEGASCELQEVSEQGKRYVWFGTRSFAFGVGFHRDMSQNRLFMDCQKHY